MTKTTMNRSTDTTVGEEILRQLGGNRFIAMTGARYVVAGPNQLSFKLPNGLARDRISYVVIELRPDDTYYVRYGYIRKLSFIVRSSDMFVHAEDLARRFSAVTGLDTHL
jgi:hypothetical protein